MDGKSPTTKVERHNSTKLSFWNWKVFGGQNEKSKLLVLREKLCSVSTCGLFSIENSPNLNGKKLLESRAQKYFGNQIF